MEVGRGGVNRGSGSGRRVRGSQEIRNAEVLVGGGVRAGAGLEVTVPAMGIATLASRSSLLLGITILMGSSGLAGWVTKGDWWVIAYEREQVGSAICARLKSAHQTEICAYFALFHSRRTPSEDMPLLGLDYGLQVKQHPPSRPP